MTRPKKIFIAEDDAQILNLLRIRLEIAGYHTICARDGFGAVTAIAKSKPDGILLDIGLPNSDGFRVLRTIRSRSDIAHIPVLMVSARHGASDVQQALLYGAQDYIAKPFDDKVLLARVARLVETPVSATNAQASLV